MPDEWETANGCDPAKPDNNALHASGYTMLEVYLDYAMKHKSPMDDGYVEPQGIEHTSHGIQPSKTIREGQLYIRRGEKTYTAQGQQVR